MPRSGVLGTATPPPGTVPKNPNDVIPSSAWNALFLDLYQISNTPVPVSYGGTGGGSAEEAIVNLGLAKIGPVGQCRLVKSGSNIVLFPYDGNAIRINGALYQIPAAGVSLAPAGLTVGSDLNVYAYVNGGNIVLEAVATGHVQDTTPGNIGVEIKAGDSTRTLVGKVRCIAGPAFVDTVAQRLVISWFNRRQSKLLIVAPIDQKTSSAVYVEVNNTFRVSFLSWGEDIFASITASVISTAAPVNLYVGVSPDNAAPSFQTSGAPSLTNTGVNMASSGMVTVSEGFHFLNMKAATTGGTMTILGFATFSSAPSTLHASIMV